MPVWSSLSMWPGPIILWDQGALHPFSILTQAHSWHILFSGGIQHWLKDIHACSITFRGFYTNSKCIHVHSSTIKGCSYSLKGIHVHTIWFNGFLIQFTLTQKHSYAVNHIWGVFNLLMLILCKVKKSKIISKHLGICSMFFTCFYLA